MRRMGVPWPFLVPDAPLMRQVRQKVIVRISLSNFDRSFPWFQESQGAVMFREFTNVHSCNKHRTTAFDND